MYTKLPCAYTEPSYTHTKSPYSFAVGQSYPRRARCDYGHVGYNSRDVYAKPAGVLGQSAYLPRSHQVRAYDFRVAVRAAKFTLRSGGVAACARGGLDSRGDGVGAHGGDGVQSAGGSRGGRAEPAHAHARLARRLADPAPDGDCNGSRDCRVPVRRVAVEPAMPDACARRAGGDSGLLLLQAVHAAVALLAGAIAGDCAERSVDCRARDAGVAPRVADAGRDAVGGGVRHPV
jgi:hypothetical protein